MYVNINKQKLTQKYKKKGKSDVTCDACKKYLSLKSKKNTENVWLLRKYFVTLHPI